MPENTQIGFKVEGQPAFPANTETENSAATEQIGEQTTGTDSTGGENKTDQQNQTGAGDKKNLGFADHPEWKSRETDWKNRFNEQETRHSQEIQNIREEMDKNISDAVSTALAKAGVRPDAAAVDIPDWFGSDDAKLWGSYRNHTEQLVTRAVEQALSKFTSKSDAEQKAIDDATNWMNTEIAAIESDTELNPNNLKVDRNKLLKTVFDNKAVDTEGRWNYRLAFKLMKPEEIFQAKTALQHRKNIAGATTEGNRAETKNPQVITSNDFRNPANRPW